MSIGDAESTPQLRRDAADNRARILAAAGLAFACHGREAEVRHIAQRAGVGMGTLYRHFPNKEALLNRVLAGDVAEWIAAAQAAAAATSGWAGLRALLVDALARQMAHRGLREHFAAGADAGDLDQACSRQLHPVLVDLVARAQQEGDLRGDVDATDIRMLLIGLGRITEVITDPASGRWQHHLDLVLDGLHASPKPRPAQSHQPKQNQTGVNS